MLKYFWSLLILCYLEDGLAANASYQLDKSASSVISLDGAWDFYWEHFYYPSDKPVTVRMQRPFAWSDLPQDLPSMGHASYVAKLEGLESYKQGFKVSISRYSSAIRLLAFDKNGILIDEVSRGSVEANASLPAKGEVSLYIKPGYSVITLVIHIANHTRERAGLLGAPVLGSPEAISYRRTLRLAVEAFTVGFIFCVAIYSFFIFLRRNEATTSLLLSILALGLGLRLISTSSTFGNLFSYGAFDSLFRMAFFSAILTLTTLLIFLQEVLNNSISDLQKKIYIGANLVIGTIILFSSPEFLDKSIKTYQAGVFVFLLLSLFVVFRAIYQKNPYAIWILAGLAVFSSGVFFDVVLVQILGESDFQLSPISSVGFIFIQLAIAARKNAEVHQKLEEYSKKLEEKDRYRSIFFENISHELRTPLHGALGYLQLLLRAKLGPVSAEAENLVKKASYLLDSLKFQIDGILALASGEFESAKLSKSRFLISDFKQELDTIAEGLKLRFPDTSYDSQFDGEDVFFISDRQMLTSLCRNLISNAFKFKDPDRTNHVSVNLKLEANRLEVCVQDTGIGIATADLESIFTKFSRIEHESVRYEGTGIGLSLVSDLVDSLGAKLEVKSELLVGSQFVLSVDSLDDLEATTSCSMPKVKTLGSAQPVLESLEGSWRICVIDDNPSNCEIICEGLGSDRISVVSFTSAKKALDFLNQSECDLVLLDMMMPEMNGADVLGYLRKDKRLAKIPVIAVTARSGQAAKIEGLRLGADDYLEKPIVIEELRLRVERLIERQALISERYRNYKLLDEQLLRNEQIQIHLKTTSERLLATEKFLLLGKFIKSTQSYMASPISLMERSFLAMFSNVQTLSAMASDSELSKASLSESLAIKTREIRELGEDIYLALSRLSEIHSIVASQLELEQEAKEFDFSELIQQVCLILESRLLKLQVSKSFEKNLRVNNRWAQLGQLVFHLLTYLLDACETGQEKMSLRAFRDQSGAPIFEVEATVMPATSQEGCDYWFSSEFSFAICEKIAEINQVSIVKSQSSQLGGVKLSISFTAYS